MMELHSLNDIFKERILRIPDYQRGYAWNTQQLEQFWEDILQLDADRVHYTGVITLEPVKKSIWAKWESDEWLIGDVDYKPFYVVDGQQRLTTSMILIQSIIEMVPDEEFVASQSVASIRKKFILFKADDGFRESYIFGYEKDNPSDEYLRTRIFGMHSHSDLRQETLYTRNLNVAKSYFKKQLAELSLKEVGILYKKVTQKFKFNLYEINDEIDVFVTFETMNNRGKPLSSLELLKNRLIYLSTLFRDNPGKEKLRGNINEAWKTIYEYLGKNPTTPLDDDEFLRNHWIMYYKYSRNKGDDYIKYLLGVEFNANSVTRIEDLEVRKEKVKEISKYVESLQVSVVSWFYLHNPYFDQTESLSNSHRVWLDRLGRLSFRSFKPLILSAFVSKQDSEKITQLLRAVERYNFTLFNLSQRRSNTGDSEFFGMSRELLRGDKSIDDALQSISSKVNEYYDPEKYLSHIEDRYKLGKDGFYRWDGVRYFLFEHEHSLKERGKQATSKLSWDIVKSDKGDQLTLEHIYPQKADDPYWVERFGQFDEDQQRYYLHTLGNLLPLSRAKNSSLQNDAFPLKVNNGSGAGYYTGSVTENEIAQFAEWTPEEILNRGMRLLEFMERRWDIALGDDDFKRKLLHLNGLALDEAS